MYTLIILCVMKCAEDFYLASVGTPYILYRPNLLLFFSLDFNVILLNLYVLQMKQNPFFFTCNLFAKIS